VGCERLVRYRLNDYSVPTSYGPRDVLVRGDVHSGDLMRAQRLGEGYPTSTLLKSSNDLGWSTLFAELPSYGQREGPGPVAYCASRRLALRVSG
jgi:hypothetical protein